MKKIIYVLVVIIISNIPGFSQVPVEEVRDHVISEQKAEEMLTRYKQVHKTNEVIHFSFSGASISRILNMPYCAAIRYYFTGNGPIITGVDESGTDIESTYHINSKTRLSVNEVEKRTIRKGKLKGGMYLRCLFDRLFENEALDSVIFTPAINEKGEETFVISGLDSTGVIIQPRFDEDFPCPPYCNDGWN